MLTALLSHAAAVAADCEKNFFGLNSWFHYLNVTNSPSKCYVDFHFPGDVPLILLAIIDDLLRIAGVVAVFFVVYGGIKYILSQGSPDEAAQAQNTIINALIGLVIALLAVGVVTYIGNRLG